MNDRMPAAVPQKAKPLCGAKDCRRGKQRRCLQRLQIRLPGVDRDGHARIGAFAPQFAAVETHRIKPLRVLTGASGVAVRENMTADHALDLTQMPAHIARQPRVGERIDIFLSLIHISEPTRLLSISYAVFCLKKKK